MEMMMGSNTNNESVKLEAKREAIHRIVGNGKVADYTIADFAYEAGYDAATRHTAARPEVKDAVETVEGMVKQWAAGGEELMPHELNALRVLIDAAAGDEWVGDDILNAAQDQILRDIKTLEFHGHLDNHILHQPDLEATVMRTFQWLSGRPCSGCLQVKADHFESDGVTPKYCGDGCSGYNHFTPKEEER